MQVDMFETWHTPKAFHLQVLVLMLFRHPFGLYRHVVNDKSLATVELDRLDTAVELRVQELNA